MKTIPFDLTREVVLPGGFQESVDYAATLFIQLATEAIKKQGFFSVALSGGSTPKPVFEEIAKRKEAVDFSKILFFFSDERIAPLADPESNFYMAEKTLFSRLSISQKNLFPMYEEGDPEVSAKRYESLIQEKIPGGCFDLVLLGVGDDGHTASLFPKTHGLHAEGRDVVANFIPDKDVWRITLTYRSIRKAKKSVVLVFGSGKKQIVKRVFTSPTTPDLLPVQGVGVPGRPALFIIDDAAANDTFNGKTSKKLEA